MEKAGSEQETAARPDTGPPPWKETFLARYPRNLKLAITVALLVIFVAPWFMFGGSGEPGEKSLRRGGIINFLGHPLIFY